MDSKEFEKQIKAKKRAMFEAMYDEMCNAGQTMVDEMKKHVAVDTGALKDSIHYTSEIGRKKCTVKVYADAKNSGGTPYWYYVEYGTGHYAENGKGRKKPWRYKNRKGEWVTTVGQKPQPFVRPAVAVGKSKISKKFLKRMSTVVHEKR